MSDANNKRKHKVDLQNMAVEKQKKSNKPTRKRTHLLEVVPIPVPVGSDHPPPPYGKFSTSVVHFC